MDLKSSNNSTQLSGVGFELGSMHNFHLQLPPIILSFKGVLTQENNHKVKEERERGGKVKETNS